MTGFISLGTLIGDLLMRPSISRAGAKNAGQPACGEASSARVTCAGAALVRRWRGGDAS